MEEDARPAAAPKRILVADDDPVICAQLKAGLAREGFAASTTHSGTQALSVLAQLKPDLIITDLMMPEQGGYELLRGLQAAGQGAIPVILITARSLDASMLDMFRQEGNLVHAFNKPLSMKALLSVVHKTLGTQSPPGPRDPY